MVNTVAIIINIQVRIVSIKITEAAIVQINILQTIIHHLEVTMVDISGTLAQKIISTNALSFFHHCLH